MAEVLLVEDEPRQLEIRRLMLERQGHEVRTAATREEAIASFAANEPDFVVMDLRLPETSDGRSLIRKLRAKSKRVRIVVVTGWPEDLEEAPEAALVNKVMRKPVRGEALASTLSRLALLLIALALCRPLLAQKTIDFQMERPGEAIAELTLSSPGCEWGSPGKEASVITIETGAGPAQHLTLFAGTRAYPYRIFLGPLAAGPHQLRLSRNDLSAAGCRTFEVHQATVRRAADDDWALRHAPILFARKNTIGLFSDVPMLLYYTEDQKDGNKQLEYTFIFSNEDGGTSSRDLMARWGRVVDIEFVYRLELNADGSPRHTLIQTKDHKEVEYEGPRLGYHPFLEVITDNNMVQSGGDSPLRYQLLPRKADLSHGSRELVLDDDPVLYETSAREMLRENKLRPNGSREERKIADPRRYLVMEFNSQQSDSVLQVMLRLKGSDRWLGSTVGRSDNFIPRSGWARLALELPPGKSALDVAGLGFQCMVFHDPKRKDNPETGRCVIEDMGKVFQLGEDYRPGASIWSKPVPQGGWALDAGDFLTLPLQ